MSKYTRQWSAEKARLSGALFIVIECEADLIACSEEWQQSDLRIRQQRVCQSHSCLPEVCEGCRLQVGLKAEIPLEGQTVRFELVG